MAPARGYNRALHVTLAPGSRLGADEVVSASARAASGEVFKARNTRRPPDGSRIAFSSARTGRYRVYVKQVGHRDNPELLLSSAAVTHHPTDWSPTPDLIVSNAASSSTGYDIMLIPVPGRSESDHYQHEAPIVCTLREPIQYAGADTIV